MSGRYPDLLMYDDNFLVRAFQIHCPALTSVDDAISMQNAYTFFRGLSSWTGINGWCRRFVPLDLSIPEPMLGGALEQLVDGFLHYIR